MSIANESQAKTWGRYLITLKLTFNYMSRLLSVYYFCLEDNIYV